MMTNVERSIKMLNELPAITSKWAADAETFIKGLGKNYDQAYPGMDVLVGEEKNMLIGYDQDSESIIVQNYSTGKYQNLKIEDSSTISMLKNW